MDSSKEVVMAKYYEQLRNVDGDISDKVIVDEHGGKWYNIFQ